MTDKKFYKQKARIEAAYKKWHKILNMDYWEITVLYKREANRGNPYTYACTWPDWEYRQAELHFHVSEMEDMDDRKIDNVVLHEFAHILIRSAHGENKDGGYSSKQVELAAETVGRAIYSAYTVAQTDCAKV